MVAAGRILRRRDLSGLTKEERIKLRKASMTAGDSWEDLHGTKSKPERQVSEWRQAQLDRRRTEAESETLTPGGQTTFFV